MKILMLTPYLPYPLLSGGQIRTYNLLKNLSKKHDITLYSLIKNEKENDYLPFLNKFCKKIILLQRTKNPWHPRNILLAGFTPYPFVVTRNMPLVQSKKMIIEELKTGNYDLIHAETFYMMPNIPKTSVPILLVEQTIEYLGYQSYADKSRIWPAKPFLYLDIAKIKYWEQFYWLQAQRLVSMSIEDKTFILNQLADNDVNKQIRVDVVANGVDMEFFNARTKNLPKNPTVLFVGTFKWLPNVEAVTFLVEKIWPLILRIIPEAKLHIVGFSPTKKILNYAKQASIDVSGKVVDIRDVYNRAHVLLAPVFSGKGTRYKILEAMATGTPVVGSSLSVEGIPVTKNQEALISDTAEGLSNHTVNLLRNKQLRQKMAKAGVELVSKNFDWKIISKELDKIYQEIGK